MFLQQAAQKKTKYGRHMKDGYRTYYDDLDKRIWETSKCRYNAAIRCKLWEKTLTYSININGMLLVLLPVAYSYGLFPNINANIFTLIMSLPAFFILIISLIEGGESHKLKEYIFHKQGVEMTKLFGKLKEVDACDKTAKEKLDSLSTINENYTSLLDFNHDPIDYELFKFNFPKGSLLEWPLFGSGIILNYIHLGFRAKAWPYLVLLFLIHWPIWLLLGGTKP